MVTASFEPDSLLLSIVLGVSFLYFLFGHDRRRITLSIGPELVCVLMNVRKFAYCTRSNIGPSAPRGAEHPPRVPGGFVAREDERGQPCQERAVSPESDSRAMSQGTQLQPAQRTGPSEGLRPPSADVHNQPGTTSITASGLAATTSAQVAPTQPAASRMIQPRYRQNYHNDSHTTSSDGHRDDGRFEGERGDVRYTEGDYNDLMHHLRKKSAEASRLRDEIDTAGPCPCRCPCHEKKEDSAVRAAAAFRSALEATPRAQEARTFFDGRRAKMQPTAETVSETESRASRNRYGDALFGGVRL